MEAYLMMFASVGVGLPYHHPDRSDYLLIHPSIERRVCSCVVLKWAQWGWRFVCLVELRKWDYSKGEISLFPKERTCYICARFEKSR